MIITVRKSHKVTQFVQNAQNELNRNEKRKKYTSQTNPNPMTMMRLLAEKKEKISLNLATQKKQT